jgi:hypothetical protein
MKYEGRITRMSPTGDQVYILVWLNPRVRLYRGLKMNWSPELTEALMKKNPIGLSVIFEPSHDQQSREGYNVELNPNESFDLDEVALTIIGVIQKVMKLPFATQPVQIEPGKYGFSFKYGVKAIDMTVSWKTKADNSITFIKNEIKRMG